MPFEAQLIPQGASLEPVPTKTFWERLKENTRKHWEMSVGAATAIPKGLYSLGKDVATLATPNAYTTPEGREKLGTALDNLLLNIPSTTVENIAEVRARRGIVDPSKAPDEYYSDWMFSFLNAAARKGLGLDELKAWYTGTATTGAKEGIAKTLDPNTGLPIYKPTYEPITTQLTPSERGEQAAGGLLKLAGAVGVVGKLTGGSVAQENLAYRQHVQAEGKKLVSASAIRRARGEDIPSTDLTPAGVINDTLSQPFIPRLDALASEAERTRGIPGVIEPEVLPKGVNPGSRYGQVWYDPDNIVLNNLAQAGELEGFLKRVTASRGYAEAARIAQEHGLDKHSHASQFVMSDLMNPAVTLDWVRKTGLPPEQVTLGLGRGIELLMNTAGSDLNVMSKLLPHWEEAIALDDMFKNPTYSNLQRLNKIRSGLDPKNPSALNNHGWQKVAKMVVNTFSTLNQRRRGLGITQFATAMRNATTQGFNSLMHSLDSTFADTFDKLHTKASPTAAETVPNRIASQSYLGLALEGLDTTLNIFRESASHIPARQISKVLEGYRDLVSNFPKVKASLAGLDVYDIMTHEMYNSAYRLFDITNPGKTISPAIEAFGKDFARNPLYTVSDNVTSVLTVFNRAQEAMYQNAHFRSGMASHLKEFGFKHKFDAEGKLLDPDVAQFNREYLAVERQVAAERARIKTAPAEAKQAIQDNIDSLNARLTSYNEAIADSYLQAKKRTFAFEPGPGEFGHSMLNLLRNDFSTAFINPYPRFMVNQLSWLMEHSPINFLDFFDDAFRAQLKSADPILRREATRAVGRALTGSIMLAGGYGLADSKFAGPTYNILRDPNNPNAEGHIPQWDLRNYSPFDSFAMLGKVLHSAHTGQASNIKISDLVDALTNIRRFADVPIFGLPDIIRELDKLNKSNPDADVLDSKNLSRLLGGYASMFMVPADYLRKINGAYRQTRSMFTGEDWHRPMDPQKITTGNPLTGPVLQTLPTNQPKVPIRIDPFTAKPIYPASPTQDVVLGLHTRYMHPLEEHMMRLGINTHEYIPKFSNDDAQNAYATAMGTILQKKIDNKQSVGEMILQNIRSLPTRKAQEKRAIELFRQVRAVALKDAHQAHPEAFAEDMIKRIQNAMPEEKQELINLFNRQVPGTRH